MHGNVIPIHSKASDFVIEIGLVKSVTADSTLVETRDGVLNAEVAFSCLVAPVRGDSVLISRSKRDCHILSILKRSCGKNMTIQFSGNVNLNAMQGTFEVMSKEARLESPSVEMASVDTDIVAKRINATSDEIKFNFNHGDIFAKSIHTTADRILQCAKTVVRNVEGIETLNVGNMIQKVRKFFNVQSQYSSITAKKDIQIDGERIHMG
jgi:hypothetical protein